MKTSTTCQFVWAAMFAAMLCALFAAEAACQDSTVTGKAFTRPAAPDRPAASPTPGANASGMGKGDLYALVVGVSQYKISNLQLKLAANDAKDFAGFLDTQKKVFKATHVKVLLNEDATKKAIEKHLEYELLKAGKDDTVIVFLSGHGSDDPKKPNDYFFLGYDADPHYLAATAVKMNGLQFLKSIDSKRVLIIADACHSGGISQVGTRSVDKNLDRFMEQFKASGGRAILTSCKAGELSQERANLPNGVFTHFLLKGLRGEADSNRDGVVDLAEAYQFAYDRTKDQTEGAQHPHLESSVEGTFPVSVATAPKDSFRLTVRSFPQSPFR